MEQEPIYLQVNLKAKMQLLVAKMGVSAEVKFRNPSDFSIRTLDNEQDSNGTPSQVEPENS